MINSLFFNLGLPLKRLFSDGFLWRSGLYHFHLFLEFTVPKLQNSNSDKTPKLKLWQNSKSLIVTKPKKKLNLWRNSNCDKTQTVTKLKLWQNSNCDKTQNVTKLKNSNWDKTKKTKCDKTHTLKLWQNINLNLWQKIL